MRQIPVRIETLVGVGDHHLRLVDGEHVEEDHHLAQVVLSARRPNRSDRGAHDCCRLAIPRAVTVRPRRPVNRVLKHAGDGVVVFGRHKENRIGLAYPLLQFHDFGRWVLLIVLIEAGDAINFESFD